MAVQKCPRCKLISDGVATMCDCGYEFATGMQRAPRSQGKPTVALSLSRSEREAIAETADEYRRLLILVFAQALLGAGSRLLARLVRAEGNPETLLVVAVGTIIVLTVMSAVAARKTHFVVSRMGFGSPSAWAVAVFAGGIFGVAFMNGRARDWAKRYGIGFGLLGPTPGDVDRVASAR